MSTDTAIGASLRIGDRDIELPIVTGTEGDDALDISALRAETGRITFDPGYGNTGACSSAITYLDGENSSSGARPPSSPSSFLSLLDSWPSGLPPPGQPARRRSRSLRCRSRRSGRSSTPNGHIRLSCRQNSIF